MHRFLEFRTVGSHGASHQARVALRSDGTLWALAGEGKNAAFQIDRGAGWLRATRVQLCRGDRLRLGDEVLDADALGALFGIETPLATRPVPGSRVPGLPAPVPLRVPEDAFEKSRRNPGTGQIEPFQKEQ